MAQWINLNRNNSFINRMRLPLLCEKPGAILLVLVGLTARWPSDKANHTCEISTYVIYYYRYVIQGLIDKVTSLPQLISKLLVAPLLLLIGLALCYTQDVFVQHSLYVHT